MNPTYNLGIIDFFNQYNSIIQATLILALVIITGFYAYSTFKLLGKTDKQIELLKKQIVPFFKLIGSTVDLTDEKCIKLEFIIANMSSAPGSIIKPDLCLTIGDQSYTFYPEREKLVAEPVPGGRLYIQQPVRLDYIVSLLGGEQKEVEIRYNIHPDLHRGLKIDPKTVKTSDFTIKFTDNLGNDHRLPVEFIQKSYV
jgi:hypothetical protein